jgi:hypothetical protein
MSKVSQRHPTVLALLLAPLLASLACASQAAAPPQISPDCEVDVNPTEADLDYILSFPGRTFEAGDWERSFTANPSRASVTWLSEELSAVAYIDYLIYGCGYTSEELAEYHSEENFRSILFADYAGFRQVAKCESPQEHLTLYQFTGQFDGTDYSIDFWVLGHGETRVLDFTLALPAAAQDQRETFAASLFPQLPSCSND